ncbi:S9 family peptidase, partial [bacterium]
FDNDIFLLNLKTRRERKIKGPQGEKDALSFSPNGKYLVYLGHHNKQDAWGVEEFHPWRIDLKTGKIKNLTPKFDRQAQDLSIADIGFDFESPKVCWSRDSRAIYYQVSDEGSTVIARARMTADDPDYVFDLPGQAALFDMAGNAMAVVHAGFKNLGDIFFCPDVTAKKAAFTKLVAHNEDYLKSRELGKTKEVRFRGHDGTRLHGWLLTPPNFNPNKKYPAILEVHGGPRAQYARVFFHEMQYLAAQGFVVFFTNPHGSQGYGRTFAESIVKAWGTKDFEDVMAAADWMEQQKFIDKKRIGITGGSYGGYMTNFALGNTRRFKAGVTQRSVVDLRTFAGTSDIGYFDHMEFGGYYWQNPQGYAKMSPLTYADKIRDPLLIIHSENDMRCPMEQAEQLYAALKIRKRKVEFLRFPEESHGLSRGGRPDRRVIRLKAIAEWFKKYLMK